MSSLKPSNNSDQDYFHAHSGSSRLLTSSDAAQYLTLSEQTLRKWRMTGGGPAFVKFGSSGRVCYRLSDLDAFIDARLQTSTSDPHG
jgi:hypothetical protein